MDAESLLDSVGMAHWLRQEDKVPEYEDMLTKAELLEWVRLLQSVWLAPDLPVSFFFFLMESTISTSLPLWLGLHIKFVKPLSFNGTLVHWRYELDCQKFKFFFIYLQCLY